MNTPAAARPLTTRWIVQHIVDDPFADSRVFDAAKAATYWDSGRTASYSTCAGLTAVHR